MFKQLLTQYVVEPTTLQPLTTEEINWMQSNVSELTLSLAIAQFGYNFLISNPCIIDGINLSVFKVLQSGTIYNYTPCVIYEPSTFQLYWFAGANNYDASLGEYFVPVQTYPDPSDPVTFSDGSLHNVMQFSQLIITGSSTGALFQYPSLMSLRGDWITVGSSGAPAYENGWTATTSGSYGTPQATASFKFNNMTQKVEFEGGAYASTSSNGTAVFNLPVKYRPTKNKLIAMLGYTYNATATEIVELRINTNGDVIPSFAGSIVSNIQVSFDGLGFDINS